MVRHVLSATSLTPQFGR